MQVILITPNRFIASGGKLDSDKGYVQKDVAGRFVWPGPATETVFMVNGQLHIKNVNMHGGTTGWKDPGEVKLTL
jgi:hypothetical protein